MCLTSQSANERPQYLEEDMPTAYEFVAREIGVSRRAEAEEAALSTAVRLAARERRLQRRLDRVHGQLNARPYSR